MEGAALIPGFGETRQRRMEKTRRFRVLTAAGCGGLLGVLAIHVGIWFDIPGFSPKTGYWGSMFLNGTLYAMGNDHQALALLSAVWFVYGALLFGGIVLGATSKRF